MNLVSTKTAKERLLSKATPPNNSGCWTWVAAKQGEGRMGSFWLNGKTMGAHRAAWIVFRGEIPKSLCVLHTCDNSLCINPEHLFLGTQADNMRDMDSKGRRFTPRGEKVGTSKLKRWQVDEIKQRLCLGVLSRNEIARIYGVTYTAIADIDNGETWKHLTARDSKYPCQPSS